MAQRALLHASTKTKSCDKGKKARSMRCSVVRATGTLTFKCVHCVKLLRKNKSVREWRLHDTAMLNLP